MMPKVRGVLNHLRVETAARQRKCHRKSDEHVIPAKQRCLVVMEKSGGKKNYCLDCAREILDRARGDLESLASELYGSQE